MSLPSDADLRAYLALVGEASKGPFNYCAASGVCQCGHIWSKADDLVIAQAKNIDNDPSALGESYSIEQSARNVVFIAASLNLGPVLAEALLAIRKVES